MSRGDRHGHLYLELDVSTTFGHGVVVATICYYDNNICAAQVDTTPSLAHAHVKTCDAVVHRGPAAAA